MDALLQFQADMAGLTVVRSATAETTALGAAFLAGIAAGVWKGTAEVAATWRESARFTPSIAAGERESRLADWHRAVARVR